MREIGIFDLKTHLSETISLVQEGEEFLVTNRGNAVALLVSPERIQCVEEAQFFSELNNLLEKIPLANNMIELKEMIEEGRK